MNSSNEPDAKVMYVLKMKMLVKTGEGFDDVTT